MHRAYFAVPFAVIIAGFTGANPARANVRVGYAMLVEQNVSGLLSGQQRKIIKGDDVFENEFIRTEAASAARLLFVDKTQLVLGPAAVAKLDRLVFNPDRSVNALTVNARAGAIRWISGDSVSSAYQIETSTVVIRPHGTAFDMLVEPQRTTVLLQEGIVEVCLINASQRCRVLSRRGELITATPNAIEATQSGGPGPSDFEDRCLSAASSGCVYRTNVTPPSGPNPPPGPTPGPGLRRAEQQPPSNTPRQAYVPPQQSTGFNLADVNPTTYADPIPLVALPPSGFYTPPTIGGGIYPGTNNNGTNNNGTNNNGTNNNGTKNYTRDLMRAYERATQTQGSTGTNNNTQTRINGGGEIRLTSAPARTRVPRQPSDGGKGTLGTKSTAGTNKYGAQTGRTGDSPRLHASNKMAHASVMNASKPAAMARNPGLRAGSMGPKRAFALAGTGRTIGGMGAPRMGGMRMGGFGGMRMGGFGGMGGLFRRR